MHQDGGQFINMITLIVMVFIKDQLQMLVELITAADIMLLGILVVNTLQVDVVLKTDLFVLHMTLEIDLVFLAVLSQEADMTVATDVMIIDQSEKVLY